MKGKIRSFGVSDDFFMYDHSPSARVGIYYYENGAYPVSYTHLDVYKRQG